MSETIMTFARLARMLAKESPCKRRGVACVVFEDETFQIVGWGVNSPGRGRICSGEKDNCGCLHSEVNTILNTRIRSDAFGGYHMVCSRSPCVPCASVIANCGYISRVYILDESEPGAHGIGALKSAGIKVEFISCPEGAEIGLRDASMKPSQVGCLDDKAHLKEQLVKLQHRVACGGDSLDVQAELAKEVTELENKLRQIA